MIAVTVTFQYDGDFDRERVLKVAEGARALFEGMPGLHYKFFTFDEGRSRAVNFYVWESDAAARAFFSDELVARVTGLYGVGPTVEYAEIAQAVENVRV